MTINCRQFKKVVFRGHGFRKSPKDAKETDIVLEAPELVSQFTKAFAMYLQSGACPMIAIDIKHKALEGKGIKFMGVDFQEQAILVLVS